MASIMLAAKSMYDDTFDNSAWASVSCGLFTLSEISQMEREFLYFLDYRLFVSRMEWMEFLTELGASVNMPSNPSSTNVTPGEVRLSAGQDGAVSKRRKIDTQKCHRTADFPRYPVCSEKPRRRHLIRVEFNQSPATGKTLADALGSRLPPSLDPVQGTYDFAPSAQIFHSASADISHSISLEDIFDSPSTFVPHDMVDCLNALPFDQVVHFSPSAIL